MVGYYGTVATLSTVPGYGWERSRKIPASNGRRNFAGQRPARRLRAPPKASARSPRFSPALRRRRETPASREAAASPAPAVTTVTSGKFERRTAPPRSGSRPMGSRRGRASATPPPPLCKTRELTNSAVTPSGPRSSSLPK